MKNYFAGYEILDGETFVQAVCRQVPERERALSGLALKLMAIRMHPELYNNEEKYIINLKQLKV